MSSSDKTSLGDRMKVYEAPTTSRVVFKGQPLVARLDGKSFHKFTRGLRRPYDERLSQLMVATTKALIERVRKNEPTIVSDSTDVSPSFGYRQAYVRDNAQRLGLFDSLKMLADGLSTDHSIRNFIGAGNASALDFGSMHWDPKDFAQGYSPTISQKHEDAQKAPDTITFSTSFREATIPIEPAPVSEPEKPFFFTDVKQLKVKKNKKKKSEKTKSSKSKRK